jgi:signal peptidase II
MERLHHLSRNSWRDIIFGSIAVFIVIIDQLTKAWIKTNLAYGQVWFDWGFLEVIHVQNTGISFGLLQGRVIFVIIIVFLEMVVILAIAYYFRSRLSFMDSMLMRVGLGLVMGGAIGNQIDRIAMGHVTDFINFKVWPAFNAADSSAVIGTIIIVYCIIFKSGLLKPKHG